MGKDGVRHLRISHTRTLRMADDVLCVRVSPDGKLLAVALLDSTVKVSGRASLLVSGWNRGLPALRP